MILDLETGLAYISTAKSKLTRIVETEIDEIRVSIMLKRAKCLLSGYGLPVSTTEGCNMYSMHHLDRKSLNAWSSSEYF